jgi:hypothetical protein
VAKCILKVRKSKGKKSGVDYGNKGIILKKSFAAYETKDKERS